MVTTQRVTNKIDQAENQIQNVINIEPQMVLWENQIGEKTKTSPLEFECHLGTLQPNFPKQSHQKQQRMPTHGL